MSQLIPPQPVGVSPGHSFWNDWIEKIRKVVNELSNGLLNHNALQNIQGGSVSERYHLTNTQHTDLTDGGDSALHFHSDDRNSANFTGTNWTDLTDAGDSTLHFHASDRARANHTGTQTMSTISDLPTLTSGTYTPTLTDVANLDGSTAYQCQYLRVGSVVTVSGRVDVNPTSAATLTIISLSLPIASNLADTNDLGGTAATVDDITTQAAGMYADTANNRAFLQWRATDTTNHNMFFSFTYRII